LVRHFEVVEIAPPTEEEAIRIVAGVKAQYETFHRVVFGEGVIEAAVFASGRFLPHRYLPDRALDLLDEAGARAKVGRPELREDVEIQRRIREIVHKMEKAIVSHDFDKARKYSEQERMEREKLRSLQAEREPGTRQGNTITTSNLEEAIAERAGVPVSAVREILQQKKGKEVQAVAQRLAAAVPRDQQAWLPFLAAYLAGCPAEEAEHLAEAIRQTKKA
ncbi:MAG TPA: hypothetical protein VGZ73_24840, partial [Bryobacteraceae bacterium]|nr:hypothetical protein [Bryobacteraceae bacterium]